MLKKIIKQAKALKAPTGFYVDRPNGYKFDLPDNILIFSRGGICPILGSGAIHHRHLLNLNLGAPCELLLDSHRFLLETGSAFLIRPYENHLFMHTNPDIFRLMITFELKNDEILPKRHSSAQLNTESVRLALDLLNAYGKQAKYWDLTLLLTLLLSRLKDDSDGDFVPLAVPENASLSLRLVRYISTHLELDLSLEVLAKRFHISKSHLRRRFQDETGVSLGEYIRKSRFLKALHYLDRNEKNISEIAELCGYSSIQAFSRAFRERFGITPFTCREERLGFKKPDSHTSY